MSTESVKYPEGHVLLRNLSRNFPIVVKGQGPYLWDASGKKYFDGSSGALVVSLGHGIAEIAEAVKEQLQNVAYVNGTQFTSKAAEDLAEKLCARAPRGLTKAFFLSSGSEAIEAAIKFARQLWVERGQPGRAKILARTPAYHGNTLYALSASAREHYRKFFGPLLSPILRVEAPYGYRSPVDYEKDGGAYYAGVVEKAILDEGPETIAAFLFEPVIGSSAGASPPPPGYFDRVSQICKKYGILMIADEVMCGAGRTGKFYASEHFALEPDLIVMGKGINSGFAPVSAVVCRGEHVEEMKQGSGGFMHAQTYMQAPCMVAPSLAVVNYMDRHHVVENAAGRGRELHELLKQEILPHRFVGNITGLGLFAGIEFVADKQTKKPFPRSQRFAEKFTDKAFENGLIVWPNVGQADGVNGDLVMIGPPLTVTTEQVRELVGLVRQTLEAL
jgi:adenosylmethionine-8-amino-7-oxononanoate aminotransferase